MELSMRGWEDSCAGGGDWAATLANWEVIFDSVLQFDFLFYSMVGGFGFMQLLSFHCVLGDGQLFPAGNKPRFS